MLRLHVQHVWQRIRRQVGWFEVFEAICNTICVTRFQIAGLSVDVVKLQQVRGPYRLWWRTEPPTGSVGVRRF